MSTTTLEIGPKTPEETRKALAFSEGVTMLATRLEIPFACFVDVMCASLAGAANLAGDDPLAKMQSLAAMDQRARAHLIDLMTQGARRQ